MLGKPWGKGEGLLHGSRSLLQLACQSEKRDLGWDQSKAVIYNTPHTATALCIPTLHIPEVPRFLQTTPSVRDQEFKPMNDFTSKPQHFYHPSMLKPFLKFILNFFTLCRGMGAYMTWHTCGGQRRACWDLFSPLAPRGIPLTSFGIGGKCLYPGDHLKPFQKIFTAP